MEIQVKKDRRMKKNKVITLISIIVVIAIAAVFFGVNYLLDAYAKYQRTTQSGNQTATGAPWSNLRNLIGLVIPDEGVTGISGAFKGCRGMTGIVLDQPW